MTKNIFKNKLIKRSINLFLVLCILFFNNPAGSIEPLAESSSTSVSDGTVVDSGSTSDSVCVFDADCPLGESCVEGSCTSSTSSTSTSTSGDGALGDDGTLGDDSSESCGDEIVQDPEECDPPDGTTCDDFCQTITLPVYGCGNDIVETGEQCDPPDEATCDTSCQTITLPAACSNSTVETGEQCDDGNIKDGDGCDSKCQIEIANKCVKGLEFQTKTGEDAWKSLAVIMAQEFFNCPFNYPQTVPENIKRTTVIHDGACPNPCPEYANLNGETLNVKKLITDYYQGSEDSSAAGSKLCALLEMEPTILIPDPAMALDNCITINYDDELGTEDFLDSIERDKLINKWTKWMTHVAAPPPVQESKSDGVTVYASSKQDQRSSFKPVTARETIGISNANVNGGRYTEYTYDIANPLINGIMGVPPTPRTTIDPAAALMDLAMGNVWPDYTNTQGRRSTGTLPFSWRLSVVNTTTNTQHIVADYMPYYHASFLAHYTAGLAHQITLANMNSLDVAHDTLAAPAGWNALKGKYNSHIMYPNFPANLTLLSACQTEPPPNVYVRPVTCQTPIKSPWNPPNPSFTSIAAGAMVERYALLLRPSFPSPPGGDYRQIYSFNADVDLIKHLLVTYYGVDGIPREDENPLIQGNIFIAGSLGSSSMAGDIYDRISRIQARARIAKMAGNTTQLLIYINAHGLSTLGGVTGSPDSEPTIPHNAIAMIWTKEGGRNLQLGLPTPEGGVASTDPRDPSFGILPYQDTRLEEYILKRKLRSELQSTTDATKNVIDNIFIIIDSCFSGAAVI